MFIRSMFANFDLSVDCLHPNACGLTILCSRCFSSEPCEWYVGYGELRHLFSSTSFTPRGTASVAKPSQNVVKRVATKSASSPFPARNQCRTLILGSGNSTFGEDMWRDGWTGKLVNLDFSEVVVSQMKQKYCDDFYHNMALSDEKKMEFICSDMTERLPFDKESFDLIICKASFDAVLSGSKSNIRSVVGEIHRLLACSHGIFFLVTNGNPDSRLEYLEYKNELSHYWQGVSVHSLTNSGGTKAASSDNK